MNNQTESLLQIPPDELGRQAVDSLRGYIYQVYQSLAAWLDLGEDETLLLEVAEDYAAVASSAITATQVKDTAGSGSVTLRSPAVKAAIQAFWNFQSANPDKKVRLNFLTTSPVGKEKKFNFPENQEGLIYWRSASREGADVEPLREALISLDLSGELGEFVAKVAPEELQGRLLRCIRWNCGAEEIRDLEQSILNRLVYLGEKQNFSPSEAPRVRDALIGELLRVVVRKNERHLIRVDLLRSIEAAVSISVPTSMLRQVTRSMASGGESLGQIDLIRSSVLDVARIPLPPRASNRKNIVESLNQDLSRHGFLWLWGSSGLGKTVLAQLITRRLRRPWFLIELRGCSPAEQEQRLRVALSMLDTPEFGGVVLDDVSVTHAATGRLWLSILATEIIRKDGAMILTSVRAPTPTLEGCFSAPGVRVREVPYLTLEDVAEIVSSAGGDADKWAGVVHAFCGAGHPQLVDARISGLQRRDWPDSELLAGVAPGVAPAIELDAERSVIRARLIEELPEAARDLLYRLTLIIGKFDRSLAMSLGGIEPPISMPGEAFDMLLGPWLESRANDRFAVSPLVSDAGQNNLPPPVQSSVHREIVDQLIDRDPFPVDHLSKVLSHSLIARHERGLTWLAMVFQSTKDNDRRRVSDELFLLTLLTTADDKLLFSENLFVSVMLRLTQFQVALETDETELLETIFDRLIAEARMIDDENTSVGFLIMALFKGLAAPSLPLRPKSWLPLLAEMEILVEGDTQIAQALPTLDLAKEGFEDWKLGQFLFVVRATSLKSIDELNELFHELDHSNVKRRNFLLSSLRDPHKGVSLMIQSAWAKESQIREIDGYAAAQKYIKLAEMAEKWGDKDLAIECECARAIMLDEYGGQPEEALDALNGAENRFPGDERIVRQRAKVLYRQGEYDAALQIYDLLSISVRPDDDIDRAFTLREAGISAAEIGDFEKARRFFCEAHDAANLASDYLLPMAAGLLGDAAVAEFQMAHYKEALKVAARALKIADEIDPEAGPKEKYCSLILGHMILWMRSELRDGAYTGTDMFIFAGSCSNPEPPEEIMERKTPPILFRWYRLAELEAELGIDAGVLGELRTRTEGREIFSDEFTLNFSLMTKIVTTGDTVAFCDHMHRFTRYAAFMSENSEEIGSQDPFDPVAIIVPPLTLEDWQNEEIIAVAKDAISAFVTYAICEGRQVNLEELKFHIAGTTGSNSELNAFVDCFEYDSSPVGSGLEIAAACIGRLSNTDKPPDPEVLFQATCYMWNWLAQSQFRSAVGVIVSDYLTERWQSIIKEQRFLLRLPVQTIPPIQVALESSHHGFEKIAEIALAAEDAVNSHVSNEMRQLMQNSLNQGSSIT